MNITELFLQALSKCKNVAVEIESEYEYDTIVEELERTGNVDVRGPQYGVMIKNPDIESHDGRLAIAFCKDQKNQIRWSGFCWPEWFIRETSYKLISREMIFDKNEDFDFNQKLALTYLFGLG